MTKPRMPVRRFDVFAEFNRLQAMERGMPPDEAAGHGLWVAKVVASGRGSGIGRAMAQKSPGKGGKPSDDEEDEQPEQEAPKEKWRTLGGEEQTDRMFEQEIVNRMGSHFYETVFAPAIEDAFREGKSYQSIRDTIRRDWKP